MIKAAIRASIKPISRNKGNNTKIGNDMIIALFLFISKIYIAIIEQNIRPIVLIIIN
jgi:hypothetical protein